MRTLMRTLALCLAWLPASQAGARVEEGLADARAARSMLSPESWARIVKIDNSRARGPWRYAVYPKTVYALVFELSGILWIYTDAEGTQSLSRTLGTVERDKADLGPLLRQIEPGIGSWAWVEDPLGTTVPASVHPPMACVEESLRALDQRLALGRDTRTPQLLFYYVSTPSGRLGHTVLLFRTALGLAAVDPELSPEPVEVPRSLGNNLVSISEYLRGAPVASARSLPIVPAPRPAPGRWATLPASPAPAG